MTTNHEHDAAGRMAIEVVSSADFDQTVAACRDALAEEGFGVLTEIDMAATLTKKLGGEHEPYLILGACHPPSAQQLIGTYPALGVLLPCNVIVSRENDETIVRAMDPAAVVAAVLRSAPDAEMDDVVVIETIADDIAGRLRSALARL
ncbi:MAG: DUF302 domain-containing protein [Acidimicrobiales bacterium]